MIKKDISYTDYDGNKREETYWFHLSKPELVAMTAEHKGFEEYLKELAAAQNYSEMMTVYRNMIARSVGQRSEDGRRFVRTEAITEDFMQSAAFEQLFMDLMSNADAATAFARGLLPADLVEEVKEEHTTEELLWMPQEDFDRIAGRDPKRMSHEHLMIAMQRKNREQQPV
jgi:hypothetical protein